MRPDIALSFESAPVLTPRQDRLEAAILHGIRTRTTRSELRESVQHLVDLFRLQGVPAEDGVNRVQVLAARATMDSGQGQQDAAGDTPAERMALVVQWARRRYGRAD